MTSISDSEYRQNIASLVKGAIARPSMYYHGLSDLESLLDGHWMAYEQLCGLTRENSFGWCFSEWLYKTRSLSGAAGWAHAVTRLAKNTGRDPDLLFAELVNEFLPEWTANDPK
jgi:hypothetical protein